MQIKNEELLHFHRSNEWDSKWVPGNTFEIDNSTPNSFLTFYENSVPFYNINNIPHLPKIAAKEMKRLLQYWGPQDFSNYLESIGSHLSPEGLFIFDYWHGPGVLTDLPVSRQKRLQDATLTVTRAATPTLHPAENLVNVHYQILAEKPDNGGVHEIIEDHRMRYFFIPELADRLDRHGMRLLHSFEWMTAKTPGLGSWTACSVAVLA